MGLLGAPVVQNQPPQKGVRHDTSKGVVKRGQAGFFIPRRERNSVSATQLIISTSPKTASVSTTGPQKRSGALTE
jgi:hypothetical protein